MSDIINNISNDLKENVNIINSVNYPTIMKKFDGEILFTTGDYELNETVANRIIEIFENGTIVDRRIPYSEYVQDEKIKELREKNRI